MLIPFYFLHYHSIYECYLTRPSRNDLSPLDKLHAIKIQHAHFQKTYRISVLCPEMAWIPYLNVLNIKFHVISLCSFTFIIRSHWVLHFSDFCYKIKQNRCFCPFQVIKYLLEVILGFEIPIHDYPPQFRSAQEILNLVFIQRSLSGKGKQGGFLVLMRKTTQAERTQFQTQSFTWQAVNKTGSRKIAEEENLVFVFWITSLLRILTLISSTGSI